MINHTRIRNISSNWKIFTMSDLSEVPISNGLYKTKDHYGKGPYMVHMGEIFSSDRIIDNVVSKVSLTEKEKEKYLLEHGDLLFARRSLKPEGAGDVSIFLSDHETSFESSIIRARLDKLKAYPPFVFYYLKSEYGKAQMMTLVRQVAVSGITGEDLKKYQIPLPEISNQIQIANILAIWDNAIEKTEALIAAKEMQFEWLTSNLINRAGHKRTAASGLMTEVSKRNKNSTIERVLSVTNHSGFVLPEEQFERRVASANVSNYKVVEQGQYAYNPSRINVGSIARLDDWENGILSPMYVVFKLDTKKVCSDYFLHWLNSSEARQRIKNSAQGSVRETVSFKDLGAIDIPLPAMVVQKDVTYKLNLAQKEISLLKNTLEQYRSQKRGLMQKLLTGEWQVGSSQYLSEETCQELSKESVA
ncbi:MAG: restriction endonuclease subunit S [Pseudoalteromonas prydzensis]|uniref:restriction endonuclease subunit S n=1 Tax=Pseudoalteromonas prydzensis TaxID=182141 RepID=UPI003F97C830